MLTGILHFILSILLYSYGLIVRQRTSWDSLFLLITYVLVLHWTFYNGECVVSYLAKKKEDPEYVAGSDVFDLKDMSDTGISPETIRIIMNILLLLWFYSTFVVLKRNRYPMAFTIPFVFILIFYNGLLRWFHDNPNFKLLQNVSMVSLILLGIYAVYLIYKKKVLYI